MRPRSHIPEIFLLQVIFYTGVWLWDEFVASYICIILPLLTAVILAISAIVDLIEPARIGRSYYLGMLVTVITPLLVMGFFYIIFDGEIAWLRPL
jgi:hypothetical protein